jgi:hypothetical protein
MVAYPVAAKCKYLKRRLLGAQVQLASVKGTGSEPGHGLKVAPQFTSMLELSHRAPVTALHWLPGVRISKEGSRPPTVRLSLATSLPVLACLALCLEVAAAPLHRGHMLGIQEVRQRAPPLFPLSSAVATHRGLRRSASVWDLAQGPVPMVARAAAPAGGGGRQTGASRLLLLRNDLCGRPGAVLGRAEQLPPPPAQEVRRRAPRCGTCGRADAVLGNTLAPAPLCVQLRARKTPSGACAWQGHGGVRVAADLCAGAARAPGGRSARRAPELCGQGPSSPVCRGGVLARGRARLGGLRAPEGAACHTVEVQRLDRKLWLDGRTA